MKTALIFITSLLLMVGCSEESITPAYQPETFQQAHNNGEFELSLSVEDVQVDEFGDEIGDVPVVGSVFQRLAGMFADISIDDENGTEVVIEPTYFDFPELDQVDFNYIQKVDLRKVHLRVANDDIDGASLSFIKRIEVYLNVDPEIPETEEEEDGTGTGGTVRPSNEEEDGQANNNNAKVDDTPDLPWYHLADASSSSIKEVSPLVSANKDENEEDSEDSFRDSILLLTYDKDRDTLGCLSKCLDMRVQPVDWRKILMKARSFSIETKLVVDSVPKAKIELGGDIKVRVVVDPGF